MSDDHNYPGSVDDPFALGTGGSGGSASSVNGPPAPKFQLGDLVRLKSVSPRLTVTDIRPATAHRLALYEVTWITFYKHRPYRLVLPEEALVADADYVEAKRKG